MDNLNLDHFHLEPIPISAELYAILNGLYPDQYQEAFARIIKRVNNLLSVEASDSVGLNVEATRDLFYLARNRFQPTPNHTPYTESTNVSLMFQLMSRVDLPEVNSLEWHEYFALNALVELEEMLLILKVPPENFHDYDPRQPNVIPDNACQLGLIAAAESIAFAEKLKDENSGSATHTRVFDAKVKEEISQRARNSGAKKHAPINELKNQFIQSRTANPSNGSTIEYARIFLKQLPADKRAGLTLSNGPNTLARAYGKHVKLNKPSQG